MQHHQSRVPPPSHHTLAAPASLGSVGHCQSPRWAVVSGRVMLLLPLLHEGHCIRNVGSCREQFHYIKSGLLPCRLPPPPVPAPASCLLLASCCLLPTARVPACPPPACLLPAACCPLAAGRCLLPAACHLLPATCDQSFCHVWSSSHPEPGWASQTQRAQTSCLQHNPRRGVAASLCPCRP